MNEKGGCDSGGAYVREGQVNVRDWGADVCVGGAIDKI